MSMIGRHKRDREEAEQARERFERRLGRMRREVDDVTTRTRRMLSERAPGLVPWVFTLGFFFGLWKPLTLAGLFRGGRRVGQLGHVLGTGATALAHSSIGREAMAMAERVMREAATPHADAGSEEVSAGAEAPAAGPEARPAAEAEAPAGTAEPRPGPGAARPAPEGPPKSEVAPAAAPDEIPARSDGGEEPGEPPSRQLH